MALIEHLGARSARAGSRGIFRGQLQARDGVRNSRLSRRRPKCSQPSCLEVRRNVASRRTIERVSRRARAAKSGSWVSTRADMENFSDALTLDANYVRRTDAEVSGKAVNILRSRPIEDAGCLGAFWRFSRLVRKSHNGRPGTTTESHAEKWPVGWLRKKAEWRDLSLREKSRMRFEILNFAVSAGTAAAWYRRHATAGNSRLGQNFRAATTRYLEVRASNAAALRFYERHNFQTVGRRSPYYTAPIEDALLLSAKLTISAGFTIRGVVRMSTVPSVLPL